MCYIWFKRDARCTLMLNCWLSADKIADQIHRFTIDYSKFILKSNMLNAKKHYGFGPMQLCLYSVAKTFIVLAFKSTWFWPYMVLWWEIWNSLITCNSTPFYLIEMGFPPEIIEFCAENYYYTISFQYFLSNAKFGHHIWRHNNSHIRWDNTNK